MKFSLIIPCYNEADNLPLLLERCRPLAMTPGTEIIIVNNGSTDGSRDVLLQLLPSHPGCRSVEVEINRGYGFGILAGLHAAKGEILGWTHADLQTDPADALRGLALFNCGDGHTFVKGRRRGRPLADVFFTASMSAFETLLLRRLLWDINAQPTIFPRSFFQTWEAAPHDFSLDLYAYCHARRNSLAVRRIAVNFEERVHGVSHWNVNWRAKLRFIRRTINYSLQLRKTL